MKDATTGEVKIDDAPATGDAEGNLSYRFKASDTDTAGCFLADWRISFPDASVEHYPAASGTSAGGLFTQVPRIGILRTSPFGDSTKFAPRNSHIAYKDSPYGGCA
jgi:hypothetical protein